MDCKYFSKCGSCTLHSISYEEQLNIKTQNEKSRFEDLKIDSIDIIKSEDKNFRNRAEFRIWKNFDNENNPTLSYAMTGFDKSAVEIDSCEIVSTQIKNLMPKLLDEIKIDEILSFKIYAIEFLGSTINDTLVTLIYHKKLDEAWEAKAKELEKKLNIKIIGRSRGQKLIVSNDFICETLDICNKKFFFEYQEGGFTQPNAKVNAKMISWVLNNIEDSQQDLCELYCGGGNFTIPLSRKFRKVLATEISKTSIKSAIRNCELNDIQNIDFIRMSAEEFTAALEGQREFRRLKDIELNDFEFDTIFVDPPRAGLDDFTRNFVTKFENIIYISCNPETLHRDLKELIKTHTIEKFAFFDQFAYTNHIESGVILKQK